MRAAPKPGLVAAGVLLAGTSAWLSVQVWLAQLHSQQSAATEAAATARAAARGQSGGPALTDIGSSYWGPMVFVSAVGLLALSVMALAFVMAGRRRSWAVLGVLLVARPAFTEPASSRLQAIGFGWTGPWVHSGEGYGRSGVPGLSTEALMSLGALVDLFVIAVPAIVFLALTRDHPRRRMLPALRIVRLLAPALIVIVAGIAVVGSVNGAGADVLRTALLVPLASALLATTRLGAARATAVVATGTLLVSPAAGYLGYAVSHGGLGPGAGSGFLGYALPILALTALGTLATLAAHAPAVASAYRRLVRRPQPAVSAA
jgi:hypothetical protein